MTEGLQDVIDMKGFDLEEEEITQLMQRTKELQRSFDMQVVPNPPKSPYTSPYPKRWRRRSRPREPDLENQRNPAKRLYVSSEYINSRLEAYSFPAPTVEDEIYDQIYERDLEHQEFENSILENQENEIPSRIVHEPKPKISKRKMTM